MSTSKFFKSFSYALAGIATAIREEFNFRVHLGAAVLAVVLALVLKISWIEWMILILVIGVVLAMELVNTGIEKLADLYSREHHPQVKMIKDLAAGAVLVAAIAALIIGAMIFLPRILGK